MLSIIKENFNMIFEACVLMILFIAGALLLAHYPDNKELHGWITGGIVIGVLARAFPGKSGGTKE